MILCIAEPRGTHDNKKTDKAHFFVPAIMYKNNVFYPPPTSFLQYCEIYTILWAFLNINK